MKYKPQKQESISVNELFDRFLLHKKRTISIGTVNKYVGFQKHIETFFRNKNAIAVTETVSESFRDCLAQKLEPVTVRERIVMMNACWEWAQKKKLVTQNPWTETLISVPPKQRPQPFTLTEISAIVHKFRSDSNLTNYADYVEFKFGVGLRTGEAAALLWRHCSPECDLLRGLR
ncbi:hypothetical protein C7B67_16495 [filamentous cyanobacterium Phorm 6]|nr:hypothetical protein C7B67_16495 [filamentous cyanobacterium Phorm 6]